MTTGRTKRLFLVVLCLALSFSMIAAAPATKMKNLRFTAMLTGAAEVPGPGDANGSGRALITINAKEGTVCWKIKVMDISLPATAAHIHVGAAGVAGPVVIGLSAPGADGRSSGCAIPAKETIRAILENPSGYYVNVHNADYPAGALRGQLEH